MIGMGNYSRASSQNFTSTISRSAQYVEVDATPLMSASVATNPSGVVSEGHYCFDKIAGPPPMWVPWSLLVVVVEDTILDASHKTFFLISCLCLISNASKGLFFCFVPLSLLPPNVVGKATDCDSSQRCTP